MESEDIFEDSYLMTKSFAAFHEMKRRGEFCDMTIKFGSQSISAHRNVIAAVIPYFREKLTNQNKETDLSSITECNLDANALECLIEFAYTSKVHLTTENVKTFVSTASFLGIDSVIDACCTFIVKRLKPEEVLSMRQYAESVSSSKLLESVDTYVCEHFDEISTCEIFLDAPFSYVKELICRNDLQPSNEEKVLDFVMKWVKKSPEERVVTLVELLSKVRLVLVQPDYLTDCLKDDVIVSSIPCRNILEDARTYHFLPHQRVTITSFETLPREGRAKQRPKGNENWASGIYAICSLPVESKNRLKRPAQSLQYFDPVKEEWSIVDVLSFTLHSVRASLIQWNGRLYFYDSDYIRAYDPPTGGSSPSISSSFYIGQRFNAGISVLKNTLYICGGTAGELIPLNTLIRLDFQDCNTVMEITPFRRSHLGTVSLNDDLYVLGGKNESDKCLCSVQKYNVVSRHWTNEASMKCLRYSMGCAVLDGKIYVCGGVPSNQYTRSAEVFDPFIKQWVLLTGMEYNLFNFSLISYDGKLYAIGGSQSYQDYSNSTNIYDPKTDKWCYKSLPYLMQFVKAVSIEQTHA